jgi:hypothetical protein
MHFLRRGVVVGLAALTMSTSALAETIGGDIATFDGLLAHYVVMGGDGVTRVDYGRWKAASPDVAVLNQFIQSQSTTAPSRLSKPEQLAYWANLYNAITLKVIIDAYPVASIRDIKSKGVWLDPKAFTGPWVEKRVTVEGREVSLDEIEHAILRPMFKDPRVHYSVNCASFGCPNLRNVAWKADTLEADLDAAARSYVNHVRGAKINDGALMVSSIYKWFRVDFGGTDAGVIAHLKTFATPELAKKLDGVKAIATDTYDWALNDTRTATAGSPR